MNTEKNFKVGDTVILKSDLFAHFPTVMTINEIEMGKVTCVWSTKDKDFSERTFSIEALTEYK
jgi:hypothetical protein